MAMPHVVAGAHCSGKHSLTCRQPCSFPKGLTVQSVPPATLATKLRLWAMIGVSGGRTPRITLNTLFTLLVALLATSPTVLSTSVTYCTHEGVVNRQREPTPRLVTHVALQEQPLPVTADIGVPSPLFRCKLNTVSKARPLRHMSQLLCGHTTPRGSGFWLPSCPGQSQRKEHAATRMGTPYPASSLKRDELLFVV